MKKVLIIASLLLSFKANAQWKTKTVDNGFDKPYRICSTAVTNNAILKLENVDGEIAFYLQGTYYCDETPNVDLVFYVNNEPKVYEIKTTISTDREVVWLVDNLLTNAMLSDFKNCTVLKIRVTDSICDDKIYSFNMSGSTTAFNFIIK